jgi:hypothetical protein
MDGTADVGTFSGAGVWWGSMTPLLDGEPLPRATMVALFRWLRGREPLDYARRTPYDDIERRAWERALLIEEGEISRAALAYVLAASLVFGPLPGVEFRAADGRVVGDVGKVDLREFDRELRGGNPSGFQGRPPRIR